MDKGWVIFAYIVVYGFMASYALYLVRRLSHLNRLSIEHRQAEKAAPAGAAITAPNLERLRGEE